MTPDDAPPSEEQISMRARVRAGLRLDERCAEAQQLATIAALFGRDDLVREVDQLGARYTALFNSAADNAMVFSARGWALESMGVPLVERARRIAQAGDLVAAEDVLASFWDERWRCERVVNRVRMAGRRGQPEVVHWDRRAELLAAAARHHAAGAYEASILIILAQVEGITADVSAGRLFF